MSSQNLPQGFVPVTADNELIFSCHPKVTCFTECCRELDLALSPYDVLRLKRHLQLSSTKVLEQYVIIEWDEGQVFPTCYLTMVDDGRASCVFLATSGCSVYENRPGSCRTYPIGRGASRRADGSLAESLVLIQEPHCKGFAEQQPQTVAQYLEDQGMASYNKFNDALLQLIHHPRIQQGEFKPSRRQLDQYILALYDLDQFRRQMTDGTIATRSPLTPSQLQGIAGSDEELLLLGIQWLLQEYFGE